MNAIVLSIGAFVALQFAVGIWVSRRVASETDFILGGRQIGLGLTALSVFATWFGAETVLGSAGRVYKDGLSGAQGEPIAYAVGILLVGAIFAVPLWRRGLTTFADFFRGRFGPSIERLTVILLVPGSVLWSAAQTRALGQIMGSAADMDTTLAITVAAIVVVTYTAFGGFLADVYTDCIQGIVIVVGLVMLLLAIAAATGGLGANIAAIEPQRLGLIGSEQSLLEFLEQWAIPICGSIVAIELMSRILASRSAEVASRGAMLGSVGYLTVALIPVLIGLFGPRLAPGLADPERLIPELAKAHLALPLYIIFVGALISAILSTVSSALLAAGSLVSHNMALTFRPGMDPAGKLRLARSSVAVLGVVAYLIALNAVGISELVELASSFASAGVFVALVFGLFTSFGGANAAMAAMLTGSLVWAWGRFGIGVQAPYLIALVAALGAYVIVGLVERRVTKGATGQA